VYIKWLTSLPEPISWLWWVGLCCRWNFITWYLCSWVVFTKALLY
jgi:hypothetical protein